MSPRQPKTPRRIALVQGEKRDLHREIRQFNNFVITRDVISLSNSSFLARFAVYLPWLKLIPTPFGPLHSP
jgi:hypothetical protein